MQRKRLGVSGFTDIARFKDFQRGTIRPFAEGLRETRSSIRELDRFSSPTGRRLTKVGLALLALPDPITDVAAIPLLAAGAALQRKKDSALTSIVSQARSTINMLNDVLG